MGGSVYAEASGNVKTLLFLRRKPHLRAANGGSGGSRGKSGAQGTDVTVKVPIGTLIRDRDSRDLHADLDNQGKRVLLAKGGCGGHGNAHFKSSVNRRPTEYTEGFAGEVREFALELRLMADIGLVGMPNAGKSSLLAALTRANPKIANYPFTTLEPNLGVIADTDSEVVAADIPGLIEGAVSGAGLGNRFLRHISRTRMLWHVVDVAAPSDIEALRRNMSTIVSELEHFENGLLCDKPRWMVFNKIDVASGERMEELASPESGLLAGVGTRQFFVSAFSGEGVGVLRSAALEYGYGAP